MTGRPTKSLEVLKQTIAEEKKKNARRRRQPVGAPGKRINFRSYIHSVFKHIVPKRADKSGTNTISSNAMTVVNDLCTSILDKVCDEIKAMKKNTKTVVVKDKDILASFKLIFPGQLGVHAVSEGVKANVAYEHFKDERDKAKVIK